MRTYTQFCGGGRIWFTVGILKTRAVGCRPVGRGERRELEHPPLEPGQ